MPTADDIGSRRGRLVFELLWWDWVKCCCYYHSYYCLCHRYFVFDTTPTTQAQQHRQPRLAFIEETEEEKQPFLSEPPKSFSLFQEEAEIVPYHGGAAVFENTSCLPATVRGGPLSTASSWKLCVSYESKMLLPCCCCKNSSST